MEGRQAPPATVTSLALLVNVLGLFAPCVVDGGGELHGVRFGRFCVRTLCRDVLMTAGTTFSAMFAKCLREVSGNCPWFAEKLITAIGVP